MLDGIKKESTLVILLFNKMQVLCVEIEINELSEERIFDSSLSS